MFSCGKMSSSSSSAALITPFLSFVLLIIFELDVTLFLFDEVAARIGTFSKGRQFLRLTSILSTCTMFLMYDATEAAVRSDHRTLALRFLDLALRFFR